MTTQEWTPKSVRQAMLDDLARSELSDGNLVRKLKLKPLLPDEAFELVNIRRAGYLIPYFTSSGKKSTFYRIRWLEETKTFGKKKGSYKYHQPTQTRPHVYFPPNIQWSSILKNPVNEITITEGEKKAVKACEEGINCIGIGGVWSFRAKRFNEDLIPELSEIEWEGRPVKLCFDSDLMYNEKVLVALNALASVLTQRGAKVYMVYIEDPDYNTQTGVKMGLDDFLVEYGVKAYNEGLKHEPFKPSHELYELNTQLAYIEKMVAIYDTKRDVFYKSATQVTSLAYAHRKTPQMNASGVLKDRKIVQDWIEWPCRRQYREMVYEPGAPVAIDGKFNCWPGWGIDPEQWEEGNIKPFMDLYDFLFKGNADFYEWLIKWLACPIQKPGLKMPVAVILWSPIQGVGKSTLARILQEIYGRNYGTIGQQQLYSQYNGWRVRKQFIVGEEITSINDRQIADRIKTVISDPYMLINEKYVPEYEMECHANFMFLSNHPDVIRLESYDRRYAVHKVTASPRAQSFYRKIHNWISRGGCRHLAHHLSQEVDLSEFNPYAPAPMTEDKKNLIDAGMTDLERWCDMLTRQPELVLRLDNIPLEREIFTLRELRVFLPASLERVTDTALGRALNRAGVSNKIFYLGPQHGTAKLYAINFRNWNERTDPEEWRQHYMSHIMNEKAQPQTAALEDARTKKRRKRTKLSGKPPKKASSATG